MYKGGGKCVRHFIDPKALDASSHVPREVYRQRIANVEKAREKHKELHPPMTIPINKPLTCGKFFVNDVLCCAHDRTSDDVDGNQRLGSCRKCAARCRSPERPTDTDDDKVVDVTRRSFYRPIHTRVSDATAPEPPPTAEAVASPQWRPHSPHKWLARSDFAATTTSSTAHTATVASISGERYGPSLRIADTFVAHSRGEMTPTTPAVYAFEHERRAQTAALAVRSQRSPQRAERKYFRSMWTPGSQLPAAGGESARSPPLLSTRVGGRELVRALRDSHARASPRTRSSLLPRA